jgi:hypothetical protein
MSFFFFTLFIICSLKKKKKKHSLAYLHLTDQQIEYIVKKTKHKKKN